MRWLTRPMINPKGIVRLKGEFTLRGQPESFWLRFKVYARAVRGEEKGEEELKPWR